MMRWQRTAVLFVVFALLLWIVLRTGKKTSEPSISDMALLRASETATEDVRIQNEFGDIHLRKNAENEWIMESPIQDRADDAAVTAMLRLLSPLETLQKQTGTRADQVTFRVDRPIATVTLREPRGRGFHDQTLRVGRKNNTFDAYYVMVDADTSTIGMVDPYVVERYFLREPDTFRYRRIADFDIEKSKRLGVETRSGRVLLERNAKRRWEVVSPIRTPADQAAANGLVRRMLGQRVERFIADDVTDPSVYGLDNPTARVSVELDNRLTYSLWVGDETEEGDVYASRGIPSRVFTISKGGREEFARSLFDLRRREMLPFEVGTIEKISVQAGDARFEAERSDDGTWVAVLDGKVRAPLRAYTVEAAVKNLGVLPARAFDDRPDAAKRHGLTDPDLIIVIHQRDGTDHTLYVRREGEDIALRVQPDGPVGIAPAGVTSLLRAFTETPPLDSAETP